MNYYAIMIALLLLTAFVFGGTHEKNKTYVILGCLIMFSIYGLRNTFRIGGDSTNTYYGGFLATGRFSWEELMALEIRNKGYYVMNKLMFSLTGGDYQLYISLLAAFIMVSLGYIVYEYSPNPLQSFLYYIGLLFFTFHFSALKQSAAMGVLMLAFDQIFKKRPVLFVLLVALAGTFHFPALVFLPAYWLAKIHLGRGYLFFLALLLIVVYLFRNQIINFMMSLYEDENTNIDLTGTRFLKNKVLLMIGIAVIAVIFRVPVKEDHLYSALLGFMGIAIVLQTFSAYSNIFERLADYYFQFSVLLLPIAFDHNVTRKSLLSPRTLEALDGVAVCVLCGFAIYRFLSYVTYNSTLHPYLFFFQS